MQADGNKRIFQLQIAKAAKIHDMYTIFFSFWSLDYVKFVTFCNESRRVYHATLITFRHGVLILCLHSVCWNMELEHGAIF